ncbi:MAG TPA: hypothetical protein VKM54_00615, partial [Myxococcota bacterium]|nr:hypothetical protein [Myxococcota bacterium]
NESFITGANGPEGVAVDGTYIYWTDVNTNSIGRANLDGTRVSQSFITGTNGPNGVTVDGTYIYWTNNGNGSGNTIGRANLDGTDVNESFITGASGPDFLAVSRVRDPYGPARDRRSARSCRDSAQAGVSA